MGALKEFWLVTRSAIEDMSHELSEEELRLSLPLKSPDWRKTWGPVRKELSVFE
jgi:hypothetical protein